MILNELIGKKVSRIFIICWPPLFEEEDLNTDLSIGLQLLNSDELFIISTDKSDNWTPTFSVESIPNKHFKHSEFDRRIKDWQQGKLEKIVGYEYYDFSESDLFEEIINQNIQEVEFLSVEENKTFGVRIKFDNDYILSTPISDGNTIETKRFNTINNYKTFEAFGEIQFQAIN